MGFSYASHVQDEYIFFRYAQGEGATVGKEFHDYHEILFIINGEAEFFSDTVHTVLKPNTVIIIPKEFFHQFVVKGNEAEYTRCVFKFFETDELSSAIKEASSRITLLEITKDLRFMFEKMIDVSNGDDTEEEKRLVMRSLLPLILYECKCRLKTEVSDAYMSSQGSLPVECIEYINKHLCEPISVEAIAKKMNVSPSTLTHSFKKGMNISVYRYILKKRLVLAQQKILSGEPAQKAALDCGFNDYSGFYKQYKKAFGIAPSKQEKFFT